MTARPILRASMSWAERHRPKDLDDIVANPTAVAELRKWAAAWQRGRPDKKAVILQGPPGIGKTSAALALAKEMGWSVVEMNASDSRNAEAIRKVATRGAVLQTFSDSGEFLRAAQGGRKLIVLDEADNVFGREDRGGIGAIVETIQTSGQPIVLIANDYYGLTRRSSSLKRLSKTIKFQPIHDDAMKNILRTITTKEGVDVASEVLDVIVERSSGDLRSAINDLESLAIGKDAVRATGTKALGYRDRERTIFPAIEEILRSGAARRADVPRHEARSPPARLADAHPRRTPPDDPDAVPGRRGAAGEPHRRPPPRGRGGRPPDGGAGVEPCSEAPPREGGPGRRGSCPRVEGRLAPRVRRGRRRCRVSREFANELSSVDG